MPAWRRWSRRCAMMMAGLLFGITVAEAGLRLLGVGFALPYAPDEHCGTRLRAGLSSPYLKEGRATVSINRHGNRDIERQKSKPKGTFRIAVLGDSYAEAMQVERDEAFWAVLEEQLNADDTYSGQKVEVLNFGVSGYGTAQELQMLRHYVWDFDPDIVLVAFLSGNDLMDNSPEIGPDQPRPYFRLTDGELVLDASFLSHPDYLHAMKDSTQAKVGLINAFRVLQVVNEVKSNWERSRVPDEERHTLDELGLDWRVYAEPEEPEWIDAWSTTAAILETMRDEVRSRGSELVVVSLSNAIQVDPDPKRRETYRDQHGLAADLFYPDRRLKSICDSLDIGCLALAPVMASAAEERQVYFHGFENTAMGTGHWNVDGHRFAGESIAEAFGVDGVFGSPD